jgi:SAM-dependent methyltransferase
MSPVEPGELAAEYRRRFEAQQDYRKRVWRALVDGWFSRYVRPEDRVLDLGCGWGELINSLAAGERYGLDLNPDAREHLDPGVTLLSQRADERWALPDDHLDVVITSNFLEHLPSREAILVALSEAHRCLRPGGTIVCLGPNMAAVKGHYWDYFDHFVPLTDRSMAEALELSGFVVEQQTARFLPYTMSGRREVPVRLVSWYLRFPLLWRVAGGQFLLVASAG